MIKVLMLKMEDDMEPGVTAADDAARKREYQKYYDYEKPYYSKTGTKYHPDLYCDLTQSDEEDQASDEKDI